MGEVAVHIDSMPLEEKQPLKDLLESLLAGGGGNIKTPAPWTKEDRELKNLLLDRAWWVLQKDITGPVKRDLLRFGREGNPGEVDAYFCALFRTDDLARLRAKITTWLKIPYLAERQEIILDSLEAHKAGRYTLTVPALLPLIDGLTRRFGRAHLRSWAGKNAGKKVIAVDRFAQHYRRKEHKSWGSPFASFIRQVAYASFDFGSGRPPTSCNRHGILHGQIPDYASEANSLRVILMLDTIAQFVIASEPRSQSHPLTGRQGSRHLRHR